MPHTTTKGLVGKGLVLLIRIFLPLVRWDETKNYWTTEGFYGISFNEGKQTLSFKTMHFGIFGLSAFRFSNLPFQSWELR